jgi:hypothetical protein
MQADGLVLGAGSVLLAAALLGLLAVMAARAVRPPAGRAARQSPGISRAAAAAGLPAPAVVGSRNALEPGSGPQAVPVRAALAAGSRPLLAWARSLGTAAQALRPPRYPVSGPR